MLATIRKRLSPGVATSVAVVALVLEFALVGSVGKTAATAAAPCATSGPGDYTVTVCVTAPSDGATISGGTTISATATVAGSSVGITRIRFELGGEYVLTDYQAPYTFTLSSDRWGDGPGTLTATARMRDGFVSSPASTGLTFDNGVTSPPVNTASFRPRTGTVPADGEPFVLAAVGDGVSGVNRVRQVADLMSAWNPNLLLYLGDVYERGSPTEFSNYWGGPRRPMGRFTSITDPTPGNHEYQFDARASGYFDFWDNVPHFYAVTAGGWRILSIDTNREYAGRTPTSQQYQWLRDQLRANADRCTLVFGHHPRFNAGEHASDGQGIAALWSLMVDEGADLYLSGHDHNFQRWRPLDGSGTPSSTGLTQIVAGTGGHSWYPVSDDPRLVRSFDTAGNAVGAVRLELGSAQARLEYRSVDPAAPQGGLLDSATIPCRDAGSETVFTDGFESGLARWTVRGGFTTQTTTVKSGAAAARAASTGAGVASAVATLAHASTDPTIRLSYRVDAQGDVLNLLRLQSAAGVNLVTLFLSPDGYLMARNDGARTNLASSVRPSRGTWHELEATVHVAGADSRLEVTNDGTPVPGLSRTVPLGTAAAVSRVMVGDNVPGRSYTSYADDVEVTIP